MEVPTQSSAPVPPSPQRPSATTRSRLPLILFLLVVVLGLTVTLIVLEYRKRQHPLEKPPFSSQGQTMPVIPAPAMTPEQKTQDSLKNSGLSAVPEFYATPLELLNAIGRALESHDVARAEQLIGKAALDEATVARLRAMFAQTNAKLRQPDPVREVGELELNRRMRYAIEWDQAPPGQERLFFDVVQNAGQWSVAKVLFPETDVALQDPLGIADTFILALLRQDFRTAKSYVRAGTVSDATLAGLCILFEEGNYRLRPKKPLRSILIKDNLATFLANVEASDGSQAAQFSLSMRPEQPQATPPQWQVTELNLDQLLSDYAQRIAGGDVYYTPLIRNPQGGDTLVLYFDFDAKDLTQRTQRQLQIVAAILRTDGKKKLQLTGHADGLGSENYNIGLSASRAEQVKAFLVAQGVDSQQIITSAKGFHEPRRPNTKQTGEDDPEGRRVNRRAEIYLDF